MTAAELTAWLGSMAKEVVATESLCDQNKVPGRPIPMPFFGDVLKARVLTVGVNPSSTEFKTARGWDTVRKVAGWRDRLINYFNVAAIPAHDWFETWSICLELLGASYQTGSAAHLDISPRPTKAMLKNAQTNRREFRAMVEHDVKWFFELLAKLPQVQLLLVAGPIPTANEPVQQLNDFIREQSQHHGCSWLDAQPFPRLTTPGHPKGIPVFVCPYEPEMDGLYAMVRHVYRHGERLRPLVIPKS